MTLKLDLRFILNTVFFQALWFACVLGAGAYEMHWLAFSALIPLAALTWTSPVRSVDGLLAILAVLVGLVIDNLWVLLGILSYPHTAFAPFWIGLLWLGLGMSINHGLRFFRDLNWIGAMIVGVFAPITYMAGERFGAVEIVNLPMTACIAIAWFGTFYGLSRIALHRLSRVEGHET